MKGRKEFFQYCALKAYQLEPEEFSYFAQLMFAYLAKGSALTDYDVLRLTGALTSKQLGHFHAALNQHFDCHDGYWVNNDLEEQIKLAEEEEQMWIRAERTSKARSLAGKKGQKVKKGILHSEDSSKSGTNSETKTEAKNEAMFKAKLEAKLSVKPEALLSELNQSEAQPIENKKESDKNPKEVQRAPVAMAEAELEAMPQAMLEAELEAHSESKVCEIDENGAKNSSQCTEKQGKNADSLTCAHIVSRTGNRTELIPCNSVRFRSELSVKPKSANDESADRERTKDEQAQFDQIQKTFEANGLFRPGILKNTQKIWELIDKGLTPELANQAAKQGRERKTAQKGVDYRFCVHYVLAIAENLLIAITASRELAQNKSKKDEELKTAQFNEAEYIRKIEDEETAFYGQDKRVTWRII